MDEDDEDVREDYDDDEEDGNGDAEGDGCIIDADDVAAVNHVQDLMLDVTDEEVNEGNGKFSLRIKLPGKETYMYKTTLVSMLNSSPDGKVR